MTTIKATCPTCGEVGLTPEDIELRIDRAEQEDSFYAFSCPNCTARVQKPADKRVVRLLLSGGVEARDLERIVTPQPRFTGRPSFSHDDILDLHTLLDTDHWFAELESLVR